MGAPDGDDLVAALRKLVAPQAQGSRYADWDDAIARRAPLRFKYLGVVWTVVDLDFRALSSMLSSSTFAGLSDDEAIAKQIDFIADHVTDPDGFRSAMAAVEVLHPATLTSGLAWMLRKEAGMPLDIVDGEDPLAVPPASSPRAGVNGRSRAGGSPRSGSSTR